MAIAVQQSLRWGLGVAVWAVLGSFRMPPKAALQVGVVAASTITGCATVMAAVFAVTGRPIWQ